MSATLQEVHAYLAELARTGAEPITYTQLAREFEMYIDSEADVGFWSRLLEQVSRAEHARGNPLLSAFVVSGETRIPSGGFFTLARELKRYSGTTERDKLTFFTEEMKRLYAHWHSSPEKP